MIVRQGILWLEFIAKLIQVGDLLRESYLSRVTRRWVLQMACASDLHMDGCCYLTSNVGILRPLVYIEAEHESS